MSDLFDLLDKLDPVPAPPVPIALLCQPPGPAGQPEPPVCQPIDADPSTAAPWAYRPLRGTPADKILRVCLCGRQDERAGPSFDHVACDGCGKPDGLRAAPWRPTAAEMRRGVMR